MFHENDLIVYGNTGVCRVKAIGTLEGISAANPERIYYTLEPIYDSKGTIYAPVDSKVFMRLVMSPDEARDLIAKIPEIPVKTVESQNQRIISDQYESSLSSHKCEDLVGLIRTIYVRNKKAADNGKKPAQVDERYMKRAKELFYGEMAAALGINFKDVELYIKDSVESKGAATH
ncbi:MAG TPA: CarD family transcriptional regulator [Candidatus Scybalocola faecigallinarum]|uniref:CarD family transcriptional regulator n=1 Tax=Candidatus Scybalocola faecigallinarum TaxID=2840941 RepID=A0A9D1F6L1_9FIRM|nr:CarD family transcriptional regulator [Candidatus Scybalocola faecigallinarum]